MKDRNNSTITTVKWPWKGQRKIIKDKSTVTIFLCFVHAHALMCGMCVETPWWWDRVRCVNGLEGQTFPILTLMWSSEDWPGVNICLLGITCTFTNTHTCTRTRTHAHAHPHTHTQRTYTHAQTYKSYSFKKALLAYIMTPCLILQGSFNEALTVLFQSLSLLIKSTTPKVLRIWHHRSGHLAMMSWCCWQT